MTNNYDKQTEDLVSAVKNLRKVLEKRAKLEDLQMVADFLFAGNAQVAVSYTHLRAHET